jgi:amylosucrase
VVYGYGGIPLIYMGDEVGLLNDHSYTGDARLAEDNRWLHRPSMPWDVVAQRDMPGTVPNRIFNGLAHLSRVRSALPSLHASVESEPVDVPSGALLVFRRRHPAGTLVQVYNVSASWQHLPVQVVRGAGLVGPWDHISGFAPIAELRDGEQFYAVPPYAAWWLGPRDATTEVG